MRVSYRNAPAILSPLTTVVRWKKPSGAYYDVEEYEDSWMIAENLDQNSLADAFRRFPADADRVRDDGKQRGKGVEEVEEEEEEESGGLDIDDFSDDDEEEEEEEEDDGGGEEEGGDDALEKSSDGMCGDDEEECGGGGGGRAATKDAKDPDVAHLGESGEFGGCDNTYVPRPPNIIFPPSSKLRNIISPRGNDKLIPLTY